jgi:hypothetical protein
MDHLVELPELKVKSGHRVVGCRYASGKAGTKYAFSLEIGEEVIFVMPCAACFGQLLMRTSEIFKANPNGKVR